MGRLRRLALRALHARTAKLPLAKCRRVAVVAPHFDDEVLGCGGVIIDLVARGVDVHLLYMTDGSKSHNHLLPEIARVRAEEARAVARHLQVPTERVIMLDYEEGELASFVDEAVTRIGTYLQGHGIDTVFGPYGKGEHPDHSTTSEIVRRAIDGNAPSVDLYEYPVWAWHHWPWSPVPLPSRSDVVEIARASLIANIRIYRDVNLRLPLAAAARTAKRDTLELYRSQMTRLVDDPRWLTLEDVAGGGFLKNFVNSDEFFHRRR